MLKKYSGANRYVLHFDKGKLPPGRRVLVADHVRYRLLLRAEPDQPLHIERAQRIRQELGWLGRSYIQNQPPAKSKVANWLPAPKDGFILMMRLYWPKETPPSILDGTWAIPAVKEVSSS